MSISFIDTPLLAAGQFIGKEALIIFEREKRKFHLILTDVMLPDQTGLELIDQLLLRQPQLRVLLMSGYTNQKSQWQIIKKRGFRFIQKPYALPNMLLTIRRTKFYSGMTFCSLYIDTFPLHWSFFHYFISIVSKNITGNDEI